MAEAERGAQRWLPELAMAAALVVLPFVFDRWLGSVDGSRGGGVDHG